MAGRALWLVSAREVSWCLVALSCGAARGRLVSSGLSIIRKDVPVTESSSEVITVSVFGCPLHLRDGAVASVLGHLKIFVAE